MVFSTKLRRPVIATSFQGDLYSYIGGIIRGEKGTLIEIGGIEDHVHILAGIKPSISVSKMLQRIKGNSSKWVNDEGKTTTRFEWQPGYSAFTVSQSQIPTVRQDIQRQADHHKKVSCQDEYLAMLQRHNIEYDPRYVFEGEYVG